MFWIYLTTDVCNHIISIVNSSEDTVIWSRLQKVTDLSRKIPTQDLFRFLYVFRNSLEELNVQNMPKFSTNDEYRSGVWTEDDLYAYIKEFKSLKNLCVASNIIKSVFVCEKLLQHCTLDILSLHFRQPNNRSGVSLSQDQLQVTDSYETYPSLKKLDISDYTPQNALVEFMYVKNKFVKFERLCIYEENNQPWEPLSERVISTITAYIFSIPEYDVCINYRINLDAFRTFFQQYIKYTETKRLTIDFKDHANIGFAFQNSKKTLHEEYPNIPLMKVRIDQQCLFQEPVVSTQAVTEFKDILKYVGSHLHILELHKGEDYDTNGDTAVAKDSFDADLIDMVLAAYPNLQDLHVDHNRYLACCDTTKGPHTGIQTIRFSVGNKFEDGFFNALSSRLPNLKRTTLEIRIESNYLKFVDINMPHTRFGELELYIINYRQESEDDDLFPEDVQLNIRITTTKDNGSVRYYCYYISPGMRNDNLESVQKREYDKYTMETLPEEGCVSCRYPHCVLFNKSYSIG